MEKRHILWYHPRCIQTGGSPFFMTNNHSAQQGRLSRINRYPESEPDEGVLILVTNDDGIDSPGLHAMVRAICDLGKILVAAPKRQYSNAGRGHPPSPVRDRGIYPAQIPVDCANVEAWSLESSPAQSVLRALVELVPRKPDLVISGINFGENMGSGVTVSGTIGAAIEAACSGIPSLAVSLQTPHEYHYNPSDTIDFSVAADFTRRFAQMTLAGELPFDVDILKVDVPAGATLDTPWRVTRVSRQSYYVPVPRKQLTPNGKLEIDYDVGIARDTLEPDSDIHALAVDRVVSVSPLSINLTSRTDIDALAMDLKNRARACGEST
jgi:5'-nucleotidase